MRRVAGIVVAASLLACTGPNPTQPQQPTPSPTRTTGASPTASPTAGRTVPPSPTSSSSATPAPAAAGLNYALYADGFTPLTQVTNAGDGSYRLYVLEQAGRIRIIEPDRTVDEAPFLDISARISSGGERGLLGLAFHPGYPDNGRFYVDYTDLDGNTVVSEFLRASDDSADPGSERVIFTVDQPFPNHNGGMVAFGPDGMLYVGMGDGGSGGDPNGNGQNPDTLLGKIVRVDVDAPTGTPSEPQIWDSGLRNPWRFSFDRQTGDLWIGDVGQAEHEEIDAEPVGTGGMNYGWNIMEGPACFLTSECDQTGLTLPVAGYTHGGGNCTVIGGYVYRGANVPDLVGMYLYADYCTGAVWSLDAAAALAGGPVQPQRMGNAGNGLTSWGEDEAGELYLVTQAGRVISVTSPASPQL